MNNEKTLFMFPGQGSQYAGMRTKLGNLNEKQAALFEKSDTLLGYALTDIIDNGPEEELQRTSRTQPALYVMGMAYSVFLDKKGYSPEFIMGHSLGEYTALAYADSISFDDGLLLVRKRGELMEGIAKSTPGKMAAVVRPDLEGLARVIEECAKTGVIEITNFNSPLQVVLSGEIGPIDTAVAEINSRKIGRAKELKVSAPFHSSLMTPIAEEFKNFLDDIPMAAPGKTFISNVTGKPESDPASIKKNLVLQLSKPVLWEQSVKTAFDQGARVFIESGPGSVLAGLVKRTVRDVTILKGENLIQE